MKYKQDPRLNVNKQVDIAERKTPPVLTILLAITYVIAYYFYQSANGETWLMRHTFQVEAILNLISTQNYKEFPGLLFFTNFSNMNIWELLVSIYFTCLFAIPVEKRLGPLRFLLLILLACTLPWAIQFMDICRFPLWPVMFEHMKQSIYFFGPYSIMLTLAGGYLVLAPKKSTDFTQSRFYRKDRTEIYNRAQSKPMNDRFGFAPNLFFGFFILYVIAAHYVFINLYPNFDTIGLYAGLSALIIGYIQSGLIHLDIEDSYQEHPLKHAAIKQYYELLDLDVGHPSAVRGAAKGLGLPDEQVETWVKKSRGKLRPS